MDFDKIKLIASDMDGTLLNSNAQLPPNFFELFEIMKSKNITFVAASGRQIHNMKNKFLNERDNIYFVAENGAYITKATETILELALTFHPFLKLPEELKALTSFYRVKNMPILKIQTRYFWNA